MDPRRRSVRRRPRHHAPRSAHHFIHQGDEMRSAAEALALFLLVCAAPSLPAEEKPGPRPAWLDRVQTYSMLPVTPATAATMNVSVNGVWAGIDCDHPIFPTTPSVRRKYGADVNAFVKDCRQ